MTADGVTINGKSHNWWSIFTKIVTVVIVPVVGWLILMIFEVSTAVAVIQANRFTEEDGANLERRIDMVEQEDARREHWGDDLVEIKETLREIMRILGER